MLEDKLKIGQIVYLTSQTSPTKITYIKEIDDDNILLDSELHPPKEGCFLLHR